MEAAGRGWVAGCKGNRLILMPGGWTPPSSYIGSVPRSKFREVKIRTENGERRFWAYAKNLTVKDRQMAVASYEDEVESEPKIIATNRLDWNVKAILKMYLKRWVPPIGTLSWSSAWRNTS